MFRVVNNKIFIGKGETPIYESELLHLDGTPYILIDGIDNPYILFIVKPGLYSSASEYKIKKYLDLSNQVKFSSYEIIDRSSDYGTPPLLGDENKLHRFIYPNNEIYKYYKDDEWIDYTFKIKFPFNYDDTSKLPAKTYWYEISLLGGSLGAIDDLYESINFKKTIIEPTEFIVEGRLSE